MCGSESYLFYAFPAVAWAAQQARPDLEVHTLVENAGSTRAEHRRTMEAALGLQGRRHGCICLNADRWTAFTRNRIYLATLPLAQEAMPSRRADPWDDGWAPRFDGPLPVMMRNRANPGEAIRASAYQYQPRFLLYRREQWDIVPNHQLAEAVGRRLPEEAREAWNLLASGSVTRQNERLALPATRFLAEHGGVVGVRAPNTRERSRAMGLSEYISSLGLQDEQCYDAQGNHFDHAAISRRLASPLTAWLRGGDLQRHRYPSPEEVVQGYWPMYDMVAAGGCRPMPHPFPPEVRSFFSDLGQSLARASADHAAPRPLLPPAEHGRRGG